MRSGFRTSWRFSVMRANRSAGVITAIVTELVVTGDKYSRRWMVMNESNLQMPRVIFFPAAPQSATGGLVDPLRKRGVA